MKKIVALHTSQALVVRIQELWEKYKIPAELVNIIDDSLIWEVIGNDGPTPGVKKRLLKYATAAEDINADYVFNTCSSVGSVAEAIKPFCAVPIIKIDEPMALKAVETAPVGGKIGVLATLPTTLPPTCALVESVAKKMNKNVEIIQFVAEGAFPELMAGKRDAHNKIVLDKAIEIAEQVDILVLAQGSMALLEKEIADLTGKMVLSSPESGVEQFLSILRT